MKKLIISLLFLILPQTVLANGNDYGHHMMGGPMPFSMNWLGFGWLFMILFWLLIIIGVMTLIKWLINQNQSNINGSSSLDVLKERLAKGEINLAEYQKIKKEILN